MPVESGQEFGQIKSYPPAKEVTDFHRNSDADRTAEAIHHSLGRSRVQASPGDHNHDGGNSLALFQGTSADSTNFDDDVSKESGLRSAVKKIVAALATKGANNSIKDNTKAWLVSRIPFFTNTTDRNAAYAFEPFGICGVGGSVEASTLYWRDNTTWRPIQDTSTPAAFPTQYAQIISWKPSTDLLPSYPQGYSLFDLATANADSGYPEPTTSVGWIIETIKVADSKGYQRAYKHTTISVVYVRRGNSTGWGPWTLDAGAPPAVTSGVSWSTGSTFEVNNYWLRNDGNMMHLKVALKYTGADITPGVSNNFTDVSGIAYVPAGWPNPLNTEQIDMNQSGTSRWFGRINTDGRIDLTHGIAGSTLSNGNVLQVNASYPI